MYDIFDLNFNTTTGNETEQVETNISLKQFPNPDFFFWQQRKPQKYTYYRANQNGTEQRDKRERG